MLAGLNIAVVDDDPAMRNSTRALLQALQATVSVFDSAETLFEQGVPAGTDVILMDLMLPGKNGLSAYQLVDEANRTPVIFVSGHDRLGNQASALGVPLLQKPYAPQALVAAIAKVLRRPNDYPRAVQNPQCVPNICEVPQGENE